VCRQWAFDISATELEGSEMGMKCSLPAAASTLAIGIASWFDMHEVKLVGLPLRSGSDDSLVVARRTPSTIRAQMECRIPYAVPRTEACEKEGSLNFRHLDTGYGKMHAPDVRTSPLFRDATVPILLPKTGRMVTEVRS
jgi:hypothetical protein